MIAETAWMIGSWVGHSVYGQRSVARFVSVVQSEKRHGLSRRDSDITFSMMKEVTLQKKKEEVVLLQ